MKRIAEAAESVRNRWFAAISLVAVLWGLSRLPDPPEGSWVHLPGGSPGRVRILQFRASVGALMQGETAQLCYGVENAKLVRIAPVAARVLPATNRCMEVGPRHTTHYTIMAVGYDGSVATRSLTLPVQTAPLEIPDLPRQVSWFA